jgi:hypothetical protein
MHRDSCGTLSTKKDATQCFAVASHRWSPDRSGAETDCTPPQTLCLGSQSHQKVMLRSTASSLALKVRSSLSIPHRSFSTPLLNKEIPYLLSCLLLQRVGHPFYFGIRWMIHSNVPTSNCHIVVIGVQPRQRRTGNPQGHTKATAQTAIDCTPEWWEETTADKELEMQKRGYSLFFRPL